LSPGRVKIILLSTLCSLVLGPTQPPMQCVRELFPPWLKRPVSEAKQSPPTSAEVKNTWNYTSTPPYVIMAECLVGHAQEQLSLSFHARKIGICASLVPVSSH
jgi:hypothetical protein